MQRLDQARRREIMAEAARLFAGRPFHEVRLDEVAAAARISKGTVYVYFKSKEDLYFSLIEEGLAELVERLRERTAGEGHAWSRLEAVVRELAAFALRFPHFFQLLRGADPQVEACDRLIARRTELAKLIEDVIRRGTAGGELCDPSPELTAQFILAFVRGAILYGPKGLTEAKLAGHMLHLLGHGLRKQTEGSR